MLMVARFFVIFLLLSGLFLLIGLIKPNLVIRWGAPETKTRKKVASLGIPAIIFSFVCIGMVAPEQSPATTQSANASQQQSIQQNPKIEKPAIQYKINEKDIPKDDPNTWRPGSKRQVSYRIQVPEEITDEQVQGVASYLLEIDTKPLKNWNVAVFWFFREKDLGSAAFAIGLYTKNGSIPDGNQVKPGQYTDFSWKWDFYR